MKLAMEYGNRAKQYPSVKVDELPLAATYIYKYRKQQ